VDGTKAILPNDGSPPSLSAAVLTVIGAYMKKTSENNSRVIGYQLKRVPETFGLEKCYNHHE
jgi:hypothetical protein